MNIIDKDHFVQSIKDMKKRCNIIGIVSPLEISIPGIPFIPAIDIFTKRGEVLLKELVEDDEVYRKIKESIYKHLKNVKDTDLIDNIRYVIRNIEALLKIKIARDVEMGIVLHIAFLVDSLVGGSRPRRFEGLKNFKLAHGNKMALIKNSFQFMEDKYQVDLGEDEIAYILKLFIATGSLYDLIY